MSVSEIAAFAELLAVSYNLARELSLLDRLARQLSRRKRVLVLGASGAGKSQFIESIRNPLALPIGPLSRTAVVKRHTIPIEKRFFHLIDTPGQRGDQPRRAAAFRQTVTQPPEGIINVVCFGYHEAAEAGGAKAVPETGNGVARTDYLKARQQVEIELLSEWVPIIDSADIKWLITLVTKADLWWPDENNKINMFYKKGPYSSKLDAFREKNLVLPYCSTVQPFYQNRTSGRFGDDARVRLRENLLKTLVDLTSV